MGHFELLMLASNSQLELIMAVAALHKKSVPPTERTESRFKRVIARIQANPMFSILFRNAPPSEVDKQAVPVIPFKKLSDLVHLVHEIKPGIFSGEERVVPAKRSRIADHPGFKEFIKNIKDYTIPEIEEENLEYNQWGEPVAWEPYALLEARVKQCPSRPKYKQLYEALCVTGDFSVSNQALAQVAMKFVHHVGIAGACKSADDVEDYWEEKYD